VFRRPWLRAWFVLLCLVVLGAQVAAQVIVEFGDIQGHGSESFIRALLFGGIIDMTEDRRFQPDIPVTRLDFAVWAARALELTTPEVSQPPFTDWGTIPEANRPQVAAIRAADLIRGFPDGSFGPTRGLRRVEMALILGRYLVRLGVKADPRFFHLFADGAQVPAWAAEASAAVRTRVFLARPVMPGAPGRFAPDEPVTRAEAAELVVRFRDIVQELAPIKKAPITPPAVLPRALVLVYYVNTDAAYRHLQEFGDQIDILVYVSYVLRGDGRLVGIDSPRTMAWGAARGRPIVAKLGNHDRSVNRELLNDPAARRRAVDGVRELMARGYSGVDLNFENVDPADRDAYTSFVAEVAAALRPQGYLVVASVPARTAAMLRQHWATAYDYAGIGRSVDFLMVMTYDQHHRTSPPGPVGALNWAEQVIQFAVSQVPSAKVLLGIPAYGYQWPDGGGPATAIFARSAINRAREANVPLAPCPVTAELTFRYRHPERGTWYRVWVTEPQGLGMKLGLIDRHNLGGLGMWRLEFEPPEYWQEFRRALWPRR